jgi:hypothetical protein
MGVSMTTLYEKLMDGKRVRYVPVSEREQWDSWPEGHYLVHVKPGSRSSRSLVAPDTAAFEAACSLHEDQLANMIVEASKAQDPKDKEFTLAQWEMWKKLKLTYVSYPSALDIARKFLHRLREETTK